MNARLEELHQQADALAAQLTEVRGKIRDEIEGRFVTVQFHGHPKEYTYEMAPGHSAKVGDYVAIHSPLSNQTELVRVIRKGPSLTLGRRSPKIARQIRWLPIDNTNVEQDDLFRGADIG